MTFVKVLDISVSNTDPDLPVVIGFRSDYLEPLKMETMIVKSGGLFEKFFPEGWLLGENKGLMLNLSANVNAKWTIRYIIVDVNGVRVR
jgi:hypothetical protein